MDVVEVANKASALLHDISKLLIFVVFTLFAQ